MRENTLEHLVTVLLGLMRESTGLDASNLGPSTLFEEIGLQSLSVVSFTASLKKFFPDIPQTFLFDCRNIQETASYLARRFPAEAERLDRAATPVERKPAFAPQAAIPDDLDWPALVPLDTDDSSGPPSSGTAIAVIGMYSRFPGAESPGAFWENLTKGVDSVREIPASRWTLDGFFQHNDGERQPGRSYSKWGAFLENVDCFDAQFFGISPREATLIDPQERIFLEVSWHAMEDAALFGERAAHLKNDDGYDIGVFAGVTTNTYALNGPDRWREGQPEIPASMPWSIANRVSFGLDLRGPSIAIDTACSSSLVAIHLACESLARKECAAALAGGVNLYLHPAKYIQLCQQQMLSPSGRCRSFGEDADGFTPGEGAGAVILKPLDAARRDGDRILSVIRGTATNHNGRTNGYTVPKARSQTALVRTALNQGGVSPGSITYVEAHGTGTKLGDPIEVSGLAEALCDGPQGDPCALGSVKSNIGHLEAAAGVASLIKTVLQLQHRQFVPSLHATRLNPALGLENTRFFVPRAMQAWRPPSDGGARRAGISSFGAGGTNAHLIIEETAEAAPLTPMTGPMVFTVSARLRDRLRASAESLLMHLERPDAAAGAVPIEQLAYTLQCGRRHFEHRLAIVADSHADLTAQLRRFLSQDPANRDFGPISPFEGIATPGDHRKPQPTGSGDSALAQAWASGGAVRWLDHWRGTLRPVSAPPYPFERVRHRLQPLPMKIAAPSPGADPREAGDERIIRLRHDSTLFRDHRMGGRPFLPATAYIAHCQRLVQERDASEIVELRDLMWLRPVSPDHGKDVLIRCKIQDAGAAALIFEDSEHPGKTCFQASTAKTTAPTAPPSFSLYDARAQCAEEANVDSMYRRFQTAGMEYGTSFRCLEAAWTGPGDVLVELRQRTESLIDEPATLLDPAMLDSALQAAGFLLDPSRGDLQAPLLPFSARMIRIRGPLGPRAFAYARRSQSNQTVSQQFDFTIFSSDGRILVEIEGFGFRPVHAADRSDKKAASELHLLRPEWLVTDEADGFEAVPTLLFDTDASLFQDIRIRAPHLAVVTRLAVPGAQYEITNDQNIRWDSHNPQHASLLWRSALSAGAPPRQLVFHIKTGQDGRPSVGSRTEVPGSVFDVIEILRSICRISSDKKFHVRVIFSSADDSAGNLSGAVAALLRAVHLEMAISASVILIRGQGLTASQCIAKELLAIPATGVVEIMRDGGKRYQKHLTFLPAPSKTRNSYPRFAEDDLFLITGGAGAVGARLATTLAQQGVKRLALTGRRRRDEKIDALIAELSRYGATAGYWEADCADTDEMRIVLLEIGRRLGNVTGVLHCAGILKDGFFLRQTIADLHEISSVKIRGALCLDELTAGTQLRWFILCSALAGVHGNVGQSHYAFANAWLDGFAEARSARVAHGDRSGKTISIAWPLWETGAGMQASDRLVRHLHEAGIPPITEPEAADIFLAALQPASPVIIPVKGTVPAVERLFHTPTYAQEQCRETVPSYLVAEPASHAQKPTPVRDAPLETSRAMAAEAEVLRFLTESLASVTQTASSKIDVDASLDLFGLDSILVMELNDLLEPHFPSLPKTAAFEARSIRALARLIVNEHQRDANTFASSRGAVLESSRVTTVALSTESGIEALEPREADIRPADIAIIGLAGRYPGSESLDAFWDHLAAGDDLVTTIPERWPESAWGQLKKDKIYARWGAFLDDFDTFDPLFFGISPRDAERMDPQERLFLQTAWHAVEDAGYTPETLSGKRDEIDSRRRVAVVAGVMYGEYQMYGAASGADPSVPLTNSSYASIANRVSFCLDLDGPSFAVDSMCSSSLSAIHLAAGLIRSQDCDLAIAGGVNLSLHPYKYRTLCELGFASTDGRCRSFGEGGDGYVPGEGVGAVLLKSLPDAIRDGDHIYGVIRGSDIGHGGRSSGYTAPNVEAQADVIRGAVRRAGLATSRISYVEAHGTGTNLGDPIEIRGLAKAMAKGVPDGRKCPIGSVKSNIGHLESAAGIAALTKVLLQMKHGRIAPSIHSDPLNKHINFGETPFIVQSRLTEWRDPDGLTRVAAISSFGAGGSNAHMIIEEHVPSTRVTIPSGPQIFAFSARGWKQLAEQLHRFASHISRERGRNSVGDPAFLGHHKFTSAETAATLFHGRRWFRCRCTVIARDFTDLHTQALQCAARLDEEEALLTTPDTVGQTAFFGEAGDLRGNLDAIAVVPDGIPAQAMAWVRGEWTAPFSGLPERWRKVPLPGYAFQRERYWIKNTFPQIEPIERLQPELAPRDWLGFDTAGDEITPEYILDQVHDGKLDPEIARTLLETLAETETSLS